MAVRLQQDADKIYSADDAFPTLASTFTLCIWFKHMASGSDDTSEGTLISLGNAFAANKEVCNLQVKYSTSSDPSIQFVHYFSDTDAVYETARDLAEGEWHGVALSFDSANPNVDPVLYVDGVLDTWDLVSTNGVGTTQTRDGDAGVIDTVAIGTNMTADMSYGASGANPGGDLAEIAFWEDELDAEKLAGLTSGFSPLFFLDGLYFYHQMQRDYRDWIRYLALTWTGIPVGLPGPVMVYPKPMEYQVGVFPVIPVIPQQNVSIGWDWDVH